VDVSEALSKINYELRGTDDDAPDFGDEDATYWLSILNKKKNELFQDVSKNWQESFDIKNVGTIAVSATPSFTLEASFLAPAGTDEGSDLYVVNDSQVTDIELVRAHERSLKRRQAYIAGIHPLKKLYLSKPVVTGEQIVGGTLYLPGYWMPADLDAADDVLPFPDPYWAVVAVAAFVASNDIVYEDKAADLNASANNLYRLMVAKSQRGTTRNPHKAKVRVNSRLGMR